MLFTELQVTLDAEQSDSETIPMYTVFQYRPEIMALTEKNIVYNDDPEAYIYFVTKLNTHFRFISDFEFAFEF